MINIGVIGCGHWGTNHVRILKTQGRVNLKICCDQDAGRLKNLNRTYPDMLTTTDYRRLIDDKGLDALVIATPTASHYKLVSQALKAGKHVFCEKPLTVKKAESSKLIALAKKTGKMLMVGYVFLYNNGIIALKEQIENDALGKINYLHFTRTNLGPIRDDVDVIYDLASHDIAISSFVLRSFPLRVSACAGYFLRKNICDVAFITLYYPKNVLVHIHVSWLDPKKIRQIICVGDQKMAVWDDLNNAEPIRIFNKGVIKEPYYSDYGEFQLLPREGEVVSPLVKLNEPLKNEAGVFIDSLENSRLPFTDAVFGHNISKVLEAIQSSLKHKGKEQAIK